MDAPNRRSIGMQGTLHENIEALAERHRREATAAPLAGRITGFVGSMAFVLLHLVVYSFWIMINLGVVPVLSRFDPSFVILAMEASVEAIFLSTFVLITQNRMAATADRRADLDLHINLLAEQELTKLTQLVDQIARRLGIEPDGRTFAEIETDVRPVEVIDALDARQQAEKQGHDGS
ncbi:MAG: DUF1003 domain-containing protein [Sphingomonas sp.]